MKKTLIVIAVASIFAACRNNPDNQAAVSTIDTANRVALDRPQPLQDGDTIVGSDGAKYVKVNPNQEALVATAPVVAAGTATRSRPVSRSTRRYSSSSGSSSNNGSSAGTSTTSTQTVKKKGWSSAAKGAVIGGAGGAVAGAIIDKKHGRGAIIGGLIGAGGGYIIGKNKDKKNTQ